MKVTLKRTDDAFQMEAVNSTGHVAVMDGSAAIGAGENGIRPMEMLLMGMGGCSSIDIVSILKKQRQDLKDICVEVTGEREKGKVPSLFESIEIRFDLEGDVHPDKALKAVWLSMEKYCSVSKIIEKTADIRYLVFLNGNQIK